MKKSFVYLLGILVYALNASNSVAQLYTPSGTVSPSANGNVGIGVQNPVYTLDIAGPGTRIMNGNGNAAQLDLVQTTGGHDWAIVSWGNTAGGGTLSNKFSIFDNTSGGHRFLIDAGGNVGIGTTSPQSKLDVIGMLQVSGNVAQAWGDYSNYVQYPTAYTSAPSYAMGWRTITNTRRLFIDNKDSDDFPVGPQGGITFRTGSGLEERLHIGFGGNVGVGTVTPQAKLDVIGAMQVTGNISQAWGDYSNYIQYPNPYAPDPTYFMGWHTFTNTRRLFIDNQDRDAGAVDPSGGITFRTGSTLQDRMHISYSGNVGIGTTNPTQKLSVNGTVRAKEVVVETSGWSDYVFADNYVLQPLADVEAQIKQEKHLPGLPSAQQVAESGIGLGEMQAKLLAKIEELTLHQIEQDKRIRALEAENAKLRKE